MACKLGKKNGVCVCGICFYVIRTYVALCRNIILRCWASFQVIY